MSTTVVTGANRGIGLQLCRLAAERGDEVIALCRQSSPELEAMEVRVEEGIDVADDAVGPLLAQRLTGVQIDVLINNAGFLRREALPDLDWDGIRQQFEINSLGPLRVTSGLLPNLDRGSKVAIISSRMGSAADNSSGASYGYRMSKAAVNIAGVSLARDCAPRGIAVAMLHPGWVRTGMTNGMGHTDAAEAAVGLLERVDALTLENSGGFWHANGESLPW
ncbi:MAG: SDR family oxidoreductase [Deltaproteobacteria bacterium]|nr:SDR family oxidoreductase [Deltaproteobacteria bacterium]